MIQEKICFSSRGEWRAWLSSNCRRSSGIWLVLPRKLKREEPQPQLKYWEARDEALCFGWIDSTVRAEDDRRIRRYFSPRRERSLWSRFNKNRVAELIEQNLMTSQGLEAIERAKSNGSYFALDSAEDLVIPPELAEALARDRKAGAAFDGLARGQKKRLLSRLVLLKTPEARARRVRLLVEDLGARARDSRRWAPVFS